MSEESEAPAAGKDTISAVKCAEALLRWITAHVYRTPLDDFRMALGAVWLSFCFDHDLNPFTELHEIADSGFPFKAALGSDVPQWLASNASAPSGAPESVSERGGGASLKGK